MTLPEKLQWLNTSGWSDSRISIHIIDTIHDLAADFCRSSTEKHHWNHPSAQSVYRWRTERTVPNLPLYIIIIDDLFEHEHGAADDQDN